MQKMCVHCPYKDYLFYFDAVLENNFNIEGLFQNNRFYLTESKILHDPQ